MLFAEIPPGFWAAGTALMMALVAIVQEVLRSMREKQAAAKVARQVAEVKTALAETDKKTDGALHDIKRTGDAVHILVNNSMSLALEAIAKLTREKADASRSKVDKLAADEADKKLQEHLAKQARVDAGPALPGQETTPQVEVTNLPPIQRVEIVEKDE